MVRQAVLWQGERGGRECIRYSQSILAPRAQSHRILRQTDIYFLQDLIKSTRDVNKSCWKNAHWILQQKKDFAVTTAQPRPQTSNFSQPYFSPRVANSNSLRPNPEKWGLLRAVNNTTFKYHNCISTYIIHIFLSRFFKRKDGIFERWKLSSRWMPIMFPHKWSSDRDNER